MSAPDDIVIRRAVPEDNAALVALAAACPMRAAMTVCVHRAPDFFALSRLQGDPWHLLVAEDARAGVVGCVGSAVRRLWMGGRPTRVMYGGDFKLHPAFRGRGRGVADRLLRAAWDLCEATGLPAVGAALAGNAPIERRAAASPTGLPPVRPLGTVRVHTLLLPGLRVPRPARLRPGGARGIVVRAAESGDVPEMLALWDRVAPGREGAPVLDAASFARFLAAAPGLALADYQLAFRGGTLLGFVGLWVQDSFKETRVLDYGASVAVAKRAHDLVARPFGWPRLPGRGEPLRALHAVHLCAPPAAPEALGALVAAARERCVREGAPAFEIGLDPRDPLSRALRPFPRMGVDVRCYVSAAPDGAAPGGLRAGATATAVGPIHFETALV